MVKYEVFPTIRDLVKFCHEKELTKKNIITVMFNTQYILVYE